MSIKDRINDRKVFGPTVQVPVPKDNPEFVLTIARFAPSEQDCITIRARRLVEEEGLKLPAKLEDGSLEIGPGIANIDDYGVALGRSTIYYLKRHVKDWTHTPPEGDPLPFNQENLNAFFDVLSLQESSDIVTAWKESLISDLKKTPTPPPGETSTSS